jgi:ribosomal protein S18 acetylase RimI-like enzyme
MIRRARHDDWDAVRELWRELDLLHAGLAPDYFRPSARAAHEWRQLLAASDGVVLVDADAASATLTGAVSVRVYDTPPDPAMVARRRGHVEMLVVGRAHRRRGIGRALMEGAASWARDQGAAELVLTVWAGNREAEAFYERLGYGELSRVLHRRL